MIRKVLVTGGSGFVGSNVIVALVDAGFEPFAVSRRTGANLWDPRAPEAVLAKFPEADAVIHLVGIIQRHRENTFERAHVEATKQAIAIAKACGARKFVHMSALGTRPDARSEYHRTKWAAEELVRASGLPYTIFRPSIQFGDDCEFIRQMLELIDKPLVTPVAGSGRGRLQPIHVRDVARFFVQALSTPASDGRAFPLGGPRVYSMEDLLETMTLARRGRSKPLLHAPVAALWPVAWLAEKLLDRPKFTRGQLTMLGEDSVCDMSEALAVFGGELADFEAWCYRALPGYGFSGGVSGSAAGASPSGSGSGGGGGGGGGSSRR